VFLPKSAETIENKRVEFLASAKKCKKAQKSAQEYEKTADSAGSEQRVVGSEERMNPYPHEDGRLSEERNCARGIAQVIENKSRCATGFRALRAEKVGGTPPYVFVKD